MEWDLDFGRLKKKSEKYKHSKWHINTIKGYGKFTTVTVVIARDFHNHHFCVYTENPKTMNPSLKLRSHAYLFGAFTKDQSF